MEKEQRSLIRNFSIIAHIDHGKSTLADKIIRLANPTKKIAKKALDKLEVEKQKGITIKLNPIRMEFKVPSKQETYIFNLIDTPGHADFSYEVSRSLASCEGVLLLVDATKGVQAQTVAYLKIAQKVNLKILPVINKVDLSSARIEETKNQLVKIAGFREKDFSFISSKTGFNVEDLITSVIDFIPCPKLPKENKFSLKALVFDLFYDKYNGVIVYIRIFEGYIKNKQKIEFFHSKKSFQVEKIGVRVPEDLLREELREGEIGWFCAGIKNMSDIQVGDTVFSEGEEIEPLPGYQKIKPNLYSNFFPEETTKYKETRKAIEELQLQDSSLVVRKVESNLLGSGFSCGFLGLLHREVIKERVKQEYKLNVITTPPTIPYKILMMSGEEIEISNPQGFPDQSRIKSVLEMFIKLTITVPDSYMGKISKICQDKRGLFKSGEIYDDNLWTLEYEMPFAEFIFDFNDRVKSASQGYASFEYEFIGYKAAKISKIDLLLNKEKIEDLSFLVHHDSAYEKSRLVCDRLKSTLNPQNFEISVQACIGKRVIARETVKAFRKDVIGKCYGGDITRKRKLLEKQKKGKKKMKEIGNVSFSKSSFRNILKEKEN